MPDAVRDGLVVSSFGLLVTVTMTETDVGVSAPTADAAVSVVLPYSSFIACEPTGNAWAWKTGLRQTEVLGLSGGGDDPFLADAQCRRATLCQCRPRREERSGSDPGLWSMEGGARSSLGSELSTERALRLPAGD